ncbi:hypothetical protein J2Z21_000928 [Streptomyces griseochromogenes]|uniref:Uncharacterized protein n=1 Tax=Streptomyces griseochromogenes TaxID=68214 RepID=A0A1B1AUX1_9ACTN|nr:hypothetical protein [Streptomyces griseochromogenes]ANP50322.1 hypothetical protein AVL59_12450 [Streptomyces griseochromogenes]MBP2048004.1 hypothetical protein [Streptomyces griseochromogenes]
MNGFQDLDSVHQVVFRWDGNHGRQGTGMNAVAHSCSAERAEELGRELGRLLWGSGPAAARPSVVRTLSRDGDVMLVQRWPTTDRGGRPSTVSHVLVGDPGVLQTWRCLALAYGSWGRPESAEQAVGGQDKIDCSQIDDMARRRLPDMLELLPTVKHALTMVAAELLRDPRQRVSLLLEEQTPPGWPDRDQVPVVYLGLFLLFGGWLRQEWTFATYDAADTHALRLMSVPRWEPDTGGSGPLARVMGRRPARPQFEHQAAAQLVKHLLSHPEADPGVPQLTEEFADGASLDWERRRARLKDILDPDRTTGRRTAPSASRPAQPGLPPGWDRHVERERRKERERGGREDRIRDPERDRRPEPRPEPVAAPPSPPWQPSAHEPAQGPAQGSPYAPGYEPRYEPGPAGPQGSVPGGQDALRRELHEHRRGDSTRHDRLRTQLGRQPDEFLLDELRLGRLPQDSLDLVLKELGRPGRVGERSRQTAEALCAQVLDDDLYMLPRTSGGEHMSRSAMVDRAVVLFRWAVAPLAREERYLRQLREFLSRMSRDPHPTTGNWLSQTIVDAPDDQIPDLPATLWRQILRDAISRSSRPPAVPPEPRSAPPPLAPLTRPVVPETPAFAGREPTVAAWFADQLNSVGCVVGSGVLLIVVALVVIVITAL